MARGEVNEILAYLRCKGWDEYGEVGRLHGNLLNPLSGALTQTRFQKLVKGF